MNENELRGLINRVEIQGQLFSSVGEIRELYNQEGKISVVLQFKALDRKIRFDFEDKIREVVLANGGEDVMLDVFCDDMPMPEKGAQEPVEEEPAKKARPDGMKQVGKIIAVASGKGGVGKSTISVNLALALAHKGYKVGICDIDVYGPSLPIQLGLNGAQLTQDPETQKIRPLESHGMKLVSLGFLVDPETPVIWRGPMVAGLVTQFTQDTDWGALDYVVLDLPPGTGDAQLTLTQNVPLDGAVVVTTPGRLALVDAIKGLQMFRKVDVPVLGFVENMSYYVCPQCGHQSEPFNSGGTHEVAERLGVPVLAHIPLSEKVQRGGDEGHSIFETAPDSPQAKAFLAMADSVLEAVNKL